MNAAPLYEVFSSIQGEATRVGERHLFVRLAGCDLECAYCDTPASRKTPAKARLFLPDGVEELANPVDRAVLDDAVARLEAAAGPHAAIALTGGEPLLFAEYLHPLAAGWRARGWTVLLETGGHRPRELETMLDVVDVVMADVKIASSAGVATAPAVAAEFLRLAATRECAAKVVVSAHTTPEEIEAVAALVPADVGLVLQPVTGTRFDPPRGEHLVRLQTAALRVHGRTRVIPQTHKTLHVR